jgi:flagella basal body P-ring formation protein FlgA
MQRTFLYSVLLIFAAWSADAAEVRLKSEAVCSGAIVRLKDVAEITSENEGEAAALAELQLFPVPAAGKLRYVRRGEIRELLALSDVNLNGVNLTGAEKLTVRRAESQSSAKPQAPIVPVVSTAFISPTTKLPRATESAGLELVPVTTRAVERGTILRSSDLKLHPAARVAGNGAAPLVIEDLIGKEVLRPLPAGHPILKETVQFPRLVRRNDKVTIKAVAAGVVITTSGKALDEGGQGDNILVEELASKEKLVARVTGYQVVEILGTGVRNVR